VRSGRSRSRQSRQPGERHGEHKQGEEPDHRRRPKTKERPFSMRIEPPARRMLADTETRLSRRPMLGPDFESPAQMPPPSDFRL